MKTVITREDKKIGKALEEFRKSKGLKASWVAAQIGIHASHLCNLEAGKKHWTPEHIANFLQAVGQPMVIVDEFRAMPDDVKKALEAVTKATSNGK